MKKSGIISNGKKNTHKEEVSRLVCKRRAYADNLRGQKQNKMEDLKLWL